MEASFTLVYVSQWACTFSDVWVSFARFCYQPILCKSLFYELSSTSVYLPSGLPEPSMRAITFFASILLDPFHLLPARPLPAHLTLVYNYKPEVYRIRIAGLGSGRIQHILNKPDRIRTTVLFKFQDQDFQISFLEFDTNTIIKRIFAKI